MRRLDLARQAQQHRQALVTSLVADFVADLGRRHITPETVEAEVDAFCGAHVIRVDFSAYREDLSDKDAWFKSLRKLPRLCTHLTPRHELDWLHH